MTLRNACSLSLLGNGGLVVELRDPRAAVLRARGGDRLVERVLLRARHAAVRGLELGVEPELHVRAGRLLRLRVVLEVDVDDLLPGDLECAGFDGGEERSNVRPRLGRSHVAGTRGEVVHRLAVRAAERARMTTEQPL